MADTLAELRKEARNVRRLKMRAAKLVEQGKKASQEFKQAERQLYQRMQDSEFSSFKVGGVQYVRQHTHYGVVQDKSAFIKWALDNDHPEMLGETPVKKLVNEYVRQCIDDGVPIPRDAGLGFYTDEYVSQRGGKASPPEA